MKRYLISTLLGTYLVTSYANNLGTEIDSLLAKKFPHASIGIVIKNAKTDQLLYSKNSSLLLVPASNVKLFTAVAALSQFKPETHFATNLSEKDGSIYITFDGSPSLTISQFTELLAHLRSNRITEIKGNIVIDGSRFKAPFYPDGGSFDDLGWYYSAPTTTVMLNENTENYDLTSGLKPGDLASLKAKKPFPQLHLINEITTLTKEEAKKNCTIRVDIKAHNTLRLYGCVGQSKQSKQLQLAIPDPMLMAIRLTNQFLQQNNIRLKGKVINGITPPDTHLIASIPSDSLDKLVKRMLQESDNLYADTLVRQLAYASSPQAPTKEGIKVIKKVLKEQYQLDMNQIKLDDGIGTRYNLVTPNQIIQLLSKIYKNPQLFSTILTSLPQSGVSGSIKDRMKKTPLEQKVFAKTGTMHDVSALSGYLIIENHDPIIFSIIINGVTEPIAHAKILEEQILSLIVKNEMAY